MQVTHTEFDRHVVLGQNTFLLVLVRDQLHEVLGQSANHGSRDDVLTPFEVVDAATQDAIGSRALNLIRLAVVVREDLRHHREPELARELVPDDEPIRPDLSGLGVGAGEQNDVGGVSADALVFGGGDPADVDDRERQIHRRDRRRHPIHKLRSELGLVGRLQLRRKRWICVDCLLEPRPLPVRARGYYVRIRRSRKRTHRVLQALPEAGLARPRRPGKDNLDPHRNLLRMESLRHEGHD